MSSKNVFYGMIGGLCLLSLLLITSVILGDKHLRKQSDHLVSLKVDNEVIEQQLTSVVQAKKDLQKYAELKSIAKQIVPQDKDQARATREILSLADQAGVHIASITFPNSTLGQAQTKTPASTDSSSATPKVTAPTISQAKPVEGIKGLYQLDMTVMSDTAKLATYNQLVDFLSRLEHNRRTAQVSQITIQPNDQNRQTLNFIVTVTVFVKP